MMWTIPTYSSKMAENQYVSRFGNIFVGRQATALLNAMAHFENETKGRAGRGPIVATNNGVGRVVGQGRGLPHVRVPILNARMPEPGDLSYWRGRGRGLSLPAPTILDLGQRISPPIPTHFTPSP